MNGLVQKFDDREAVVGIVGLGYVGLPLMLRYVEVGYRVIGFDIDPGKVEALDAGSSYISHIPDTRVSAALDRGLEVSADYSRAAELDALILCVPTPLNDRREPDLSYVIGTTESLLPYLRKGQVLSLESTTYPGTTDEELLPRITSRGLTVGTDFFLVYSPEREDPGNPDFETGIIPKVCGGHTPACLEVGLALYRQAIEQLVPVSSTRAAEMTKLLENIHRAVNIGLVNEMKIVADRMDIDIREVIDAASTKPFGFTPYYPGPGLGGHCIPIDPFYLTWKARQCGIETRFIELAGEVNTDMPAWVIDKLASALVARSKVLEGSRILVLGIAYKANVGDTRESPAVEIMRLLTAAGAIIDYSDPYVPKFPVMRQYSFDLVSVALTQKTVNSYDCVLIATNHDDFDYEMIKNNAELIVDTRGVYKETFDRLIKA